MHIIHIHTQHAQLFSLWEAVWLHASSHYHWYLYTLSTPRSFLCHMHSLNTIISSQPSLPRVRSHTRRRTHTHHRCLAFTRCFKTGSTAGNMLVTYVACLLSLSEKLFVCGWASAYVSPMTIRSGLLWCCCWVWGWGWGVHQRLEQRRRRGERMGSRIYGTETSIKCATLTSSGQNETRLCFAVTSANFCTLLSLLSDITRWIMSTFTF